MSKNLPRVLIKLLLFLQKNLKKLLLQSYQIYIKNNANKSCCISLTKFRAQAYKTQKAATTSIPATNFMRFSA